MLKVPQGDGGFTLAMGVWPAYDHRADGKGQHVAEFHMALVGPLGAVVLRVFTGWTWGCVETDPGRDAYRPSPRGAGVSYHAASGTGEGTTCEFTPAGRCWSEGVSFTGGDPIFKALVQEGEGAVWGLLRELYDTHAWGERP